MVKQSSTDKYLKKFQEKHGEKDILMLEYHTPCSVWFGTNMKTQVIVSRSQWNLARNNWRVGLIRKWQCLRRPLLRSRETIENIRIILVNQVEHILSDHVAEQTSDPQISRISQNSQISHHVGWKEVSKMVLPPGRPIFYVYNSENRDVECFHSTFCYTGGPSIPTTCHPHKPHHPWG